MHRRQPLPRLWLMTDERQGVALWTALQRLPRGSGVIFRHYSLPAAERRALFTRVRKVSRRRRLLLILAGDERTALAWRAEGWHGRGRQRLGPRLVRTVPAHDLAELRAAERSGAGLVFMSPVFATRSHPGAQVLGRIRLGLLTRGASIPVIALGGMDARRARHVPGAYGWAGIDAWSAGSQKRKAVPR